MTTRQREFCYHYAAGLPASKAAHAAGYARSTCEHNGALLLRNPHVIYTITLMQQGTPEHIMDVFLRAKKRACHTLDYSTSEPAAQSASREMRGWSKILLSLPPDRALLPNLEHSTEEDTPTQQEATAAGPVAGAQAAGPLVGT